MSNTFGQRLTGERKRLGLSQADIADQIGASKRSVIDWEADGASPKADYLVRMSGLGLDVTYVLTGHHVDPALLDQLTATSQVTAGVEPDGGPLTEKTVRAHANAGKAASQIAEISGALSRLPPEDLSIVRELVVRLNRGYGAKRGSPPA